MKINNKGKNTNTVVFVSFENQYAPWGGLSAVMKKLPPIISKSINTVFLSPFFQNIKKTQQSVQEKKLIHSNLTGHVTYKGFKHKIELYESTEFSEYPDFKIYLIKCDKFFLAGENPYNDTWRFDSLFHDSYFFSKAVPVALSLIKAKFTPPYVLNLQDWETSLVAETMPYNLPNKCVLTLHNPYDEYLIDDPEGRTIFEYTIPKMQGISTVSEHFAHELRNDPLLTEVICRKLQGHFQYLKPIGINNGNFVDLEIPPNMRDLKSINTEKLNNRQIFNLILKESEELLPKWGSKFDLMENNKPIFLLFGRDDPKQKGLDVAAAAIYRLLKKGGKKVASFIFAPIPSTDDLTSISYLEDLGTEFKENIMIFPFRLAKGYKNLQKAANFIIMPSYYEPFGAANEGYASGTPIIARATGGLIQQVCPLNYDTLPEKIKKYVKWYHPLIKNATGFLYREDANTETADNWKYLFSTDFSKKRSIQEPVDWRNPLFWSMVTELETTIEKAVTLYTNDKESYYQLILNGFNLFKQFNWEKSAEKYKNHLYKMKK